MADAPGTPQPRTRAEQQRATRRALIDAAREVFARDGYHGANLSRIAKHAGFSKGAVYSNFEHKAALFLAVMDEDLRHLRGESWDPLHPYERERCSDEESHDAHSNADEPDLELLRGFALATLEFVAAAVRSKELNAELLERLEVLLGAYTQVAASGRSDDEVLEDRELGALLTALDQGVALLVVSGMVAVDGSMLRTGLRRLLSPAPDEPATSDTGEHTGLRSIVDLQNEVLDGGHLSERTDP